MKRYYKLFNDSNTNLDEFDDLDISKEKAYILKNRVSKKIYARNLVKRKAIIASVVVMSILLTPALTNETVLANINHSINKLIEKFKADESTTLFEKKVSSQIVVYSAHNSEIYDNGLTVVDVGKKINSRLNEMNLESIAINSAEPNYEESFEYSNALIQNNIENYKESFLIDVHRDQGPPDNSGNPGNPGNPDNAADISFYLIESNPLYKECESLAEKLIETIQKNSDLKVKILPYTRGHLNFNQDLSPTAISVNIGYNNYSEDKINEIIDVFTEALKEVIQNR